MPVFDVTMPPVPGEGGATLRVVVEAASWLDAWRDILRELGESVRAEDVTCSIHPDHVEIVHIATGQRLFVRAAQKPEVPAVVTDAQFPAVPARVRVSTVKRPRVSERLLNARAEARRKRTSESQQAFAVIGVPYIRELSDDREALFEEVASAAFRHIVCRAAQVLVPERHGKLLRVVAAVGDMEDQVVGAALPAKQMVLGHVIRSPARVKLAGDGTHLRYRTGLLQGLEYPVRSVLWAPIRNDGEQVGVLLLLNSRHLKGFSEREMTGLSELAALAGERLGDDEG